jgi:hypothetical protein
MSFGPVKHVLSPRLTVNLMVPTASTPAANTTDTSQKDSRSLRHWTAIISGRSKPLPSDAALRRRSPLQVMAASLHSHAHVYCVGVATV